MCLLARPELNPGLAGHASIENMGHNMTAAGWRLWLVERNSLELSQSLSHHHPSL